MPPRMDMRCEAYTNCKVGHLSRKLFDQVTVNSASVAFEKFRQNDVRQWQRLLFRCSGLFKLDLHTRVAITMLELSTDRVR